jgi:hypothetical protein
MGYQLIMCTRAVAASSCGGFTIMAGGDGALILVAESNGPTMMARIGVMRALNRCYNYLHERRCPS